MENRNKKTRIICFGDSGIDFYKNHNQKKVGGCSLNVAYHLTSLLEEANFDISLLSPIGNDENAMIIQGYCEQYSLDSYFIKTDGKTPIQTINISKTGEKEFIHYNPGVLEAFILNEKDSIKLNSSDLIVSVVFKQNLSMTLNLLNTAKETPIWLDFMDMSDFEKDLENIILLLKQIEVGVFGLDQIDDKSLIIDLVEYSKENPIKFLITLNTFGSMWVESGNIQFAQLDKVEKAIDTTGAGDSFLASYLSNYLTSKNIKKSLIAANKYASRTVKVLGAHF